MKNAGFTTTITVDQTPEEAYAAVNNARGWWSGEIKGTTDQVGAEFTYRYRDFHRSVQRITELTPGKRVVWHVTESRIHSGPKDEWKGTDIVFDIAAKDGKTEIRFTHAGLVPRFSCYGDCSNAWGTLVQGNLRKLIATGAPQPDAFAKFAEAAPGVLAGRLGEKIDPAGNHSTKGI